MRELSLGPIGSVVCLGAHADDIEIGSGGTIRRFADRYPEATFTFVVLTGSDVREAEAEKSMRDLVGEQGSLRFGGFRDGHLPYDDPTGVKEFVRETADIQNADLVLTPWREDRHQDHAFVAHLTDQILRNHLILGYEIAKYEGDLGQPQAYVELSVSDVEAKEDHLARHFASQHEKPWYAASAFRSLMRIRGIEAGAASGYAEAFHASKILLG